LKHRDTESTEKREGRKEGDAEGEEGRREAEQRGDGAEKRTEGGAER